MKAIIQNRYGGPDTLEYSEVEMPTPGAKEVLIQVRGASINAADWLLMHGRPAMIRIGFGLRRPRVRVRGRDVSGVVAGVGSQVDGFQIGDEVFAEVDAGSFAEYTVAPMKRLARKPPSLSFIEAATLPVAAATALQGLRDTAKLKPGDTVLINGASGGVGSFAVQIAKSLGATVTGVCSGGNAERVRSLGADEVIDYATTDFAASDTRYDVVLDVAGNRSLRDLRRALTPRGTLVLASGAGGPVLGPIPRILRAVIVGMFVRQRLRPLVATVTAEDLVTLGELVESGKLRSTVEQVYPLTETAAAISHFGDEHAKGKICISI